MDSGRVSGTWAVTQWKDLRFCELVSGRVSAGAEVRERIGSGRDAVAG